MVCGSPQNRSGTPGKHRRKRCRDRRHPTARDDRPRLGRIFGRGPGVTALSRTLSNVPIHWDDIEIVQTLHRLEGEGRAYGMMGSDLLAALAGDQQVLDQDRLSFIRLLLLMHQRGLLTFEMQGHPGVAQPRPQDSHFLQWVWHFQLTERGRDRAIGRVVLAPPPAPGEDNGRTIPHLVLNAVADVIAAANWYSGQQVNKFFASAGLPQALLDPQRIPAAMEISAVLTELEESDSELRRSLRRFLAAFLNSELAVGPERAERMEMIERLGKAGWHLTEETLVVGEPVQPSEETPAADETKPDPSAVDQDAAIFLVHGHAHARLQEVARFIERITGRDVVILHEQPNQGRTLIEKFEQNAERAAHSVILLTADDVGRAIDADPSEEQPRGRQNVVLELGFFFGKLGRRRVTVLRDPEVEEPSDVRGIVYISLDDAGSWKVALGRELDASAIPVDMTRAP